MIMVLYYYLGILSYLTTPRSAALTISEAMERNIKLSHEKQQTVHELQRTSSELRNAEAEITRNKEELTTLRGKVKLLHSGKLAAEQKAAENMTVCCKLEVRRLVSLFLDITFIDLFLVAYLK